MLAVVFLVDLLVFLDLARAELREQKAQRVKRTARRAIRAGHPVIAPGNAPS